MARPVRKQETRATQYVYRPPSSLDIPDDLVKSFDKLGYSLRWIRFMVNGQEDIQNITKRMREGYTFIDKSELPDEFIDWFQTKKIRSVNQAICVGDLVLAKIEKDRAQARRDYFQGLSSEQVKAARREATQTTDKRMNTAIPVIDESESDVEITT